MDRTPAIGPGQAMSRIASTTAAVALIGVSFLGAIHSMRAGISQALYRRARYSVAAEDAHAVLRLCHRAHRLYAWNYSVCSLAAERAYYASPRGDPSEERRLLAATEHWTAVGLALNPYIPELNLLRVRLLARESLSEAIQHWERYVDWHFWEPHNHAVMAELYAENGDFNKAYRSLSWTKRTEHYAPTREAILRAWQREMTAP